MAQSGLLGIQPPQNCSCQELISQCSSIHYGWLRKRNKRNRLNSTRFRFFDWPQYYVVIADACLYYFKSETSKKPSGAVSLYGYNRVFRSSEIRASEVPWSFKIEHIQPTMKAFHFSAPSEREMIKWMTLIKEELLTANNMNKGIDKKKTLGSHSDDSMSSWGSSDYKSLEESVYPKGSVDTIRQSLLLELAGKVGGSVEESSDEETSSRRKTEYDTIASMEPSSSPPKIPAPGFYFEVERRPSDSEAQPVYFDEACPSQESVDALGLDGYHMMQEEESNYWKAVHFAGSKVEASEIINSIASNGVYLVRKSEDGQDVLQVYADDTSRKYRMFKKDDGQHTLSLTNGPFFDSLEEMLFHYYSKTLPQTTQCLTVPYRLHPEFIKNEKH